MFCSYADDVFKVVADDLKLRVPDYTGATVILKSSNKLPDINPKTYNSKNNSRKRKIEEILQKPVESETKHVKNEVNETLETGKLHLSLDSISKPELAEIRTIKQEELRT